MEKEYVVGIDIGGQSAKIGLVNRRGEIIARKTMDTTKYGTNDENIFMNDLCEAISAMIQGAKTREGEAITMESVNGIGIGAPNGNFKGIIEDAANLPWAKGKTIALANKETMVVAGEIINELAHKHQVAILPVDSEHSAIFQCLEYANPLEKIILTASGGPFRKFSLEELRTVGREQALKHPNWAMGAKITIDSASMMNKGFEVIEAKWLFGLRPEQIEVVVHPQSI